MSDFSLWETKVWDVLDSCMQAPEEARHQLLEKQRDVQQILAPVRGDWYSRLSTLRKLWLAISAGSIIDPRGILGREINQELKAINIVLESLEFAKPYEKCHK